MKYKLLLLDVDGVLVKNKDAPVSQKVIASIKSIKDMVTISLCTGRTQYDCQRIIETLDIYNSYHVIESGAKVLNKSGVEENVKSIQLSDVKWIIASAKDTPRGYGFCVDGNWVDSIEQIESGAITTVSLHSHNQKQTAEILNSLTEVGKEYNIAVGSHWQVPEGNFILITHPEATKGKAISYIQGKLGIKRENTISIGDMPNDLPLFEESGFKIAMGNADIQLKNQADIIAPSIYEDGVAFVIEKYLY